MAFKTLTTVLAATVANAATFTVPYPAGTVQADFTAPNDAADGVLIINSNDVYNEADADISIAYGASNITITNATGSALAAGSTVDLQLGQAGGDSPALEPADAIADTASGATLADVITKQNEILAAMRSQGIIAS